MRHVGAIYPPRPNNRRIAWPVQDDQPPPPPVVRPAAALSASANLTELDLAGWTFAPSHNDRQCVQVSLELGTLCRLLTCPCGQEERTEWARRLLLEAQERLPDAPLKNLFTSLGRESWETARLRKRREREVAEAKRAPAPAGAVAEREELAAELAHFTAVLRRAIHRQAPTNLASKADAPPA